MSPCAGVIAAAGAASVRSDEDEEDDFTKIALQVSFDGLANGATSAVDTSMYAHPITFVDTAAISTAQQKFGTSSLTGSYCTVPMDPMFSGFGGEFGIEFFFRLPVANSSETWTLLSCGIQDLPDYDSYAWRITYTGSSGFGFNGLSFQWHEDGEGALNHSLNWIPNTLTASQWYHGYFGRDASNRIRIYLDGDLKTEVIDASLFHTANGVNPLSMLGFTGDGVTVNSFMQYLRISKDRSLYSGSSFTPPAAPPF